MIGQEMYSFAQKLFPINRSITGEGVRQTLAMCSDYIAGEDGVTFEIKNVPSGTEVFDWTVPKEWKINEAYIEDEAGNRICDMAVTNLHIMGYSTPIDEWVDLEELKQHVFTLPDQPDVIPYVTSYYKERYGFCMSQTKLNGLKPGRYHMYIDSKLFDGNLTYAELVLPGSSEEEIFFSTYDCHPSMANNEVSGPVLMCQLINYVKSLKNRRYTYRFIIIPETIGAITYLATAGHLQHMKDHIVAGFNLSCVGDDKDYSIVHSKYADTLADRVLTNVLKTHTNNQFSDYSFLKRGSDERQYNSAGVDLPVVCFCRSKFGEYPEYHTSADDMDFISPEGFEGAYQVMTQVVDALEYNKYYVMTQPCEPQLGKRGLFPTVSKKGSYDAVMAMMYFMTYADGRNDLLGISEITGVPVRELIEIVDKLYDNGLIEIKEFDKNN
ncbi:MAG: DUF4910 domain-containing protein [Pseudobutyrivibrio sp.]|nr:DUF4910 domain-containing protein [Pseudobutyrivibrio sp.]